MIFLPIARRELRVAARKRSTFWIRILAGLIALLIGSGFYVISLLPPFRFGGGGSVGRYLFNALTWLTLGAALSLGLFFTSDCLSEEKREGTIGFLFLTDLSGYDVVVGKLLATSLRGFYALLAIFPILGASLMLGGVTGSQFWRTTLALMNALSFSLAVGLFVSALSRESHKAMWATLFLLMLFIGGGPALDRLAAAFASRPFQPLLSLSSPGYLFVAAGTWGGAPFWRGLLINQGVVWGLLGLTCAALPRAWRPIEAKGTMATAGRWRYAWKFGGKRRRAMLRGKLLAVNPVLWLSCRERWQSLSFWAAVFFMAGGAVLVWVSKPMSWFWMGWGLMSGAATLLLYLGISSQAGRFFFEAKRSGLMQLILGSPLSADQIVQGQWRALVRMFGPALALFLVAQSGGNFLYSRKVLRQTKSMASSLAGVTNAPGSARRRSGTAGATGTASGAVTITTGRGRVRIPVSGLHLPGPLEHLALSLVAAIQTLATLVALAWFGMWTGLNAKSLNLATLRTLLLVIIIPWFAIAFLSMVIVPLLMFAGALRWLFAGSSSLMGWYPFVTMGISTVLVLGKDALFILWARRMLLRHIRQRATWFAAPIRSTAAPPVIVRENP